MIALHLRGRRRKSFEVVIKEGNLTVCGEIGYSNCLSLGEHIDSFALVNQTFYYREKPMYSVSSSTRFASWFRCLCLTLVCLLGATSSAQAMDEWADQVIGFSSQYGTTRWAGVRALGVPDTFFYGDIDSAWAPARENGTSEYLKVGFAVPLRATGVTVRETSGNGFVTKVEVTDTSNLTHLIWKGVDASLPGSPVDFQVSFSQTSYFVKAVKIYVSTKHSIGYEEIDAIQLHGTPGVGFENPQWAQSVIDFSSQYDSNLYSAKQALLPENTFFYVDSGTSWEPSSQNGTKEYLTVGFPVPVYATGAMIRENSGSGFVTQVDALDVNDVLHTVWKGKDTSKPGSVANLQVSWIQTNYLVKGIKVYVDTSHDPVNWEAIDAVQLYGTPASLSVAHQ